MLRPWLELIRLPAVFTAPADVLAGAALAAAFGASVGADLLLLIAASLLIYAAGMAANDLCDAAVDAEERPGRPIPSGRISKAAVWMFVLGLQGLGVALGAAVGPASAAAVGATVGATWLYNGALKSGPLGPPAMGLCRYGNALIGASPALLAAPLTLWLIPLGTLLYVTALTTVSRYEVEGATAAQLRLPVGALLAAALLPAIWPLTGLLPVMWAAAAVLLPLLWLIRPIRAALAAPSPGSVKGVVMAGIFGIAMVNAVLALAAGGYWQAALAAGLLVPGKSVGRWFYST